MEGGSKENRYDFLHIFQRRLKEKGYVVTAAPQCPNLGNCPDVLPDSMTEGHNALSSMFGVPSNTFTYKGILFDKEKLINVGKMVPKNKIAFGLKPATINPSL